MNLDRKSIGVLFLTVALLLITTVAAGAQAQENSGAANPTSSRPSQGEIDGLLAAYQEALELELQTGETSEVVDELGETSRMLAGRSAEKMDALWQQTLQQINALTARPEVERGRAVNLLRSLTGNDSVSYLDRDRSLYDRGAQLERYQTERFIYSVDIATNDIVEARLVDEFAFSTDARYSLDELQKIAADVAAQMAPNVNLTELQLSIGEKSEGSLFFFRWESASRLQDGALAFLQVALSSSGDLVHYVNTLPFVDQRPETDHNQPLGLLAKVLVSPSRVFNEIYANGGGYWQWLLGSYTTQSNAGYCYIAGWCSPKNFFWKTTCYGCVSAKGRWSPSASLQAVKTSAFVPSTHATTLQACYTVFYNGVASSTERCVRQDIYYNTWVALTPSSLYNIGRIELSNIQDSSSLKEIAWDETWVYTP